MKSQVNQEKRRRKVVQNKVFGVKYTKNRIISKAADKIMNKTASRAATIIMHLVADEIK